MAQEKPSRISEWLILLRKQAPIVRAQFGEWIDAVREEPRLIWETNAVRYVAYLVAAIVLLCGAKCASRMIAPPPPSSAKEAATTGDFHVLCSDPQCADHFVIHRPFGYSTFPVKCPKCERMTGERANQCHSSACQGRWVIPEKYEGGFRCPLCQAPLP